MINAGLSNFGIIQQFSGPVSILSIGIASSVSDIAVSCSTSRESHCTWKCFPTPSTLVVRRKTANTFLLRDCRSGMAHMHVHCTFQTFCKWKASLTQALCSSLSAQVVFCSGTVHCVGARVCTGFLVCLPRAAQQRYSTTYTAHMFLFSFSVQFTSVVLSDDYTTLPLVPTVWYPLKRHKREKIFTAGLVWFTQCQQSHHRFNL